MIESRSEPSLPPPLKIGGAEPARRALAGEGVMKLNQGFAEGKRMVPGPGKNRLRNSKPYTINRFREFRISARTNGQPDNEAGLKLGFTEEKCFQCLKPGAVDPGRE